MKQEQKHVNENINWRVGQEQRKKNWLLENGANTIGVYLESYNAELIRQGKNRPERFELLMEMRNKQLTVLLQANADFNFKKLIGNDPKQLPE